MLAARYLPEADEAQIRRRMKAERDGEFGRLKESAKSLSIRTGRGQHTRMAGERQVATLRRRLADVAGRDYFESHERVRAERAIERARHGLNSKPD